MQFGEEMLPQSSAVDYFHSLSWYGSILPVVSDSPFLPPIVPTTAPPVKPTNTPIADMRCMWVSMLGLWSVGVHDRVQKRTHHGHSTHS